MIRTIRTYIFDSQSLKRKKNSAISLYMFCLFACLPACWSGSCYYFYVLFIYIYTFMYFSIDIFCNNFLFLRNQYARISMIYFYASFFIISSFLHLFIWLYIDWFVYTDLAGNLAWQILAIQILLVILLAVIL